MRSQLQSKVSGPRESVSLDIAHPAWERREPKGRERLREILGAMEMVEGAHARQPPFLGEGSRKGSRETRLGEAYDERGGEGPLCTGLCAPHGSSQASYVF